jgi:hypothetical protein
LHEKIINTARRVFSYSTGDAIIFPRLYRPAGRKLLERGKLKQSAGERKRVEKSTFITVIIVLFQEEEVESEQ